MSNLKVGVIGCGLIGERRAIEASAHVDTSCALVYDTNSDVADKVAHKVGARIAAAWQDVVHESQIDVVCVATPNAFLVPIASAALDAGKHVLIEKPMGRGLTEAEYLASVAKHSGKLLKIGFNHRYHPAIASLHAAVSDNRLGPIINARCRYGHGARPGYEREWRGNRELAGGGELTDQGVHVADLLYWFLGMPKSVFGVLQSAVWPLNGLEDNGYAILRYESGAVATFHTSWTQWKNLFSFEIFGELGSGVVEGLGRSYGVETLTFAWRKLEGGAPLVEVSDFAGPDDSWRDEWSDFVRAILDGRTYLGTPTDGIAAMRTLAAIYRSAETGSEQRL